MGLNARMGRGERGGGRRLASAHNKASGAVLRMAVDRQYGVIRDLSATLSCIDPQMKLLQQDRLIRCPAVTTLAWDGNDLVDITSGMRLHPDGSLSERTVAWAYPFDRAIGLRDCGTFWAVAYTNRQTKAILLGNGQLHRELNRSFNFAHAYDYPIALARSDSGKIILIHCPSNFDTLEIEDAETGATLARMKTDQMEFHSRLAVSSNSRHLLDAGWFWHPVGGAWLGDLTGLLAGDLPGVNGHSFSFGAEIDSVAFLDNDHVVVTSTDAVINDVVPPGGIGPRQLGLWSIRASSWVSRVDLSGPSGAIMAWRDWVISFYEFPKAIEISTGKIVHRWDKIYSGKQIGSIDLGSPPPPVMALDPERGRFAVQVPEGVAAISLAGLAAD